jgi:cytidine deaminase
MSAMVASRRNAVKKLILQHGGYLPVQFVQQLLSDFDITVDQFMLGLLPVVSEFAVMPVCGFMVGAVALGETGNIYCGSSQDFGGMVLSQAVHAEQAAVAMAQLHGETGLVKIAVNARPCGHCRQFLYELVDGGALKILLPETSEVKLSTLLPDAFGPKNLGSDEALLMPQKHALRLIENSSDPLIQAALKGAMQSYAPYTKAYSGVALQTNDGKIFMGSYLENVAFNPSLPALQSALVNLVQCGYSYDNVKNAVLVQLKNNVIDQVAGARMVLQVLCPTVQLQVFEAAV